MGQGGERGPQQPPGQLPCPDPTELKVLSSLLLSGVGKHGGRGRRPAVLKLRGGGQNPSPSLHQEGKGLWGQVAAIPQQEIQGHRFLPTPLNSGPRHPKTSKSHFCDMCNYLFLTLHGGCVGNFQPFDAYVTPPHSQSCERSSSAGSRVRLLQQGPGVGSLGFLTLTSP